MSAGCDDRQAERHGNRTHMPVLDGTNEGSLVDDLATRRVDDKRTLLQTAELVLADEPLRLLLQRRMYAEHVRLREELVQALLGVVLTPGRQVRLRVAR